MKLDGYRMQLHFPTPLSSQANHIMRCPPSREHVGFSQEVIGCEPPQSADSSILMPAGTSMPALVGSINSSSAHCLILYGIVLYADIIYFQDYVGSLSYARPTPWLVFIDEHADLSELTAETIYKIRERGRPIAQRLAASGKLQFAWVCPSTLNDTFVDAWFAFVAADPAYPTGHKKANSVREACDILGLSHQESVEMFDILLRKLPSSGHHYRQ